MTMIDNLTDATRLLKAAQLMLLGKDNQPISDLYYALQMALDLIEESEWISVKDSLPKENVDVIVSDMETYETYSAYYVGGGYWACDNGTYKHRITHWKPFPKKCDESGETIGEKFLSGWRNKSEDNK